MKTLHKVLVCAVMCILTIPVFAKITKTGATVPSDPSRIIKVTALNPFTWQVSEYRVRLHLHEVQLGPASWTNNVFIDIVEDSGTTPLVFRVVLRYMPHFKLTLHQQQMLPAQYQAWQVQAM